MQSAPRGKGSGPPCAGRHSETQVFGGWDMLRCFLGENVSLSLEPGEEFHANEVWDTRKKK